MDAIEIAAEREQLVLTLYCSEELNFKADGAVLEVKQIAVSQFSYSQAIKRYAPNRKSW